ncbi:hypothetical protein BGZ75_006086 [Mortierella antarctica]|nr:hypothetical protein BGZ75_006086 [Mortierella antarctica]
MGVSQSTVLKIRATVLNGPESAVKDPKSSVKDPESAAKDPESSGLSDIDQDVDETAENDLPLASTKYEKWRSQYIRPWKDMLYIDYNKRKEVKEVGAVTCSEAIGYGMLISVLMRNQKDFDGLNRWFLKFKNKRGLVAWQQVKSHDGYRNNPEGGDDSATDGDIDVATALLYAAHVWGKSADGKQDYRKLGIDLCKAIWDHDFNHKTYMPLLGDWSENDKKFLLVTRPSDFILSAFVTFKAEDTERSEQWGKVLDATISTMQRQLKKYPNGLISDFMKGSSKGQFDPSYNWNSCRVPWRLTAYYLLTQDERVKPIMIAQGKFFTSVKEIKAGYKLNGKPISDRDYGDKAYTAPVALELWALKDQSLGKVLKQMKELESDKSYYGDSIQMLCLLQARDPRGYETK